MAKPNVTLSRWDTTAANMTAPSSGQRDTGIVSGAAAVSSYVNYLFNAAYNWALWLDGQFTDAGNVKVAQTLWVPGSAFNLADSSKTWARTQDAPLIETDGSGAYSAFAPLVLPVGVTITGVIVYLSTAVDSGTRQGLLVEAQNFLAGHSVIGSASNASNSSNLTLTITGMPYTVLDAHYYQLQAVIRSFDQVAGAKVVYTLP